MTKKKPKYRRLDPVVGVDGLRQRIERIERARRALATAADELTRAAPAAAAYVRRCLKSVDGALRHAHGRLARATERCPHPMFYTIDGLAGRHRCTSCGDQFTDQRRDAR